MRQLDVPLFFLLYRVGSGFAVEHCRVRVICAPVPLVLLQIETQAFQTGPAYPYRSAIIFRLRVCTDTSWQTPIVSVFYKTGFFINSHAVGQAPSSGVQSPGLP